MEGKQIPDTIFCTRIPDPWRWFPVHSKSIFEKQRTLVFSLPGTQILQLIGIAGWTYVALKWNERALLLNFLPQVLIIVPGLIYLFITK